MSRDDSMKRTPLFDIHISSGAKMIEFAGWEMPVQYTTILEEHRAVRTGAGAFDVSHMGDILIRGEGAEELVRILLTNDIRGVAVGKGIYGHILNDEGHILDDTIVFHMLDDQYWMVPNASTADRIFSWVKAHSSEQEVIDLTKRVACIALQGPKAETILRELTTYDLRRLKRFRGDFLDIQIPRFDFQPRGFLVDLLPNERSRSAQDGAERCYLTRTGYTGEDGFEILMEAASAIPVWRALFEVGQQHGLKPAGLGSRDLLRLEMGYLLSGTDFDGSESTLQTGPEWAIKWDHEFVGREAMLQQRQRGGFRRLVGLELIERGIPRHNYQISIAGNPIGRVTSGTLSPCLNKGIALGYVDPPYATVGTEVEIVIRDSTAKAQVVKPPFIKRA